jgi:hypothetical protein
MPTLKELREQIKLLRSRTRACKPYSGMNKRDAQIHLQIMGIQEKGKKKKKKKKKEKRLGDKDYTARLAKAKARSKSMKDRHADVILAAQRPHKGGAGFEVFGDRLLADVVGSNRIPRNDDVPGPKVNVLIPRKKNKAKK